VEKQEKKWTADRWAGVCEGCIWYSEYLCTKGVDPRKWRTQKGASGLLENVEVSSLDQFERFQGWGLVSST
jgi:hypothetical protein